MPLRKVAIGGICLALLIAGGLAWWFRSPPLFEPWQVHYNFHFQPRYTQSDCIVGVTATRTHQTHWDDDFAFPEDIFRYTYLTKVRLLSGRGLSEPIDVGSLIDTYLKEYAPAASAFELAYSDFPNVVVGTSDKIFVKYADECDRRMEITEGWVKWLAMTYWEFDFVVQPQYFTESEFEKRTTHNLIGTYWTDQNSYDPTYWPIHQGAMRGEKEALIAMAERSGDNPTLRYQLLMVAADVAEGPMEKAALLERAEAAYNDISDEHRQHVAGWLTHFREQIDWYHANNP